ncbi:ferric reductase like transmembrane component domain-containing protein [Sarocladium implicatum]|nr:ferric reductase like transmembrane component domain-containing protein [Sarocladium implicatum]
MSSRIKRQHMQDHTLDLNTTNHFGYPDRQTPCVSGHITCAYLDAVYAAHDNGIIYTGVIWLTFLFVLTLWTLSRFFFSSQRSSIPGISRAVRGVAAASRHYLLPDSLRLVFGRTTRLQVLILAILTAYLTLFSFIGITYSVWYPPSNHHDGVDIRSSLGPWSNRVGVLAYALTPLSVMLASRESLLSVLTGVPYQHFNFMHRWVGYIIVVQSVLHTVGWVVVVVGLYQPQPTRGNAWVKDLYMIWGLVAILLVSILYILSLPFVIRRTGYEFFRKSHYILAMIYCGACIGHWDKLHCFITPAIILWFIDRFTRLFRTYLIHRKAIGENGGFFHPAQASATLFPNNVEGDIVRLDFKHPSKPWKIGQHFYLCFTDGSIWQSHPFTPLNAPVSIDGVVEHSYIFRAKAGETRKVADILKEKSQKGDSLTTPVILTGPYGESLMDAHRSNENLLCVAGGTGITYVLPPLLATMREGVTSDRKIELIWFVRHASDVEWIRSELDALEAATAGPELTIRVFTTRDADETTVDVSSSSSSSDEKDRDEIKNTAASQVKPRNGIISIIPASSIGTAGNTKHPDVGPLVETFIDGTICGSTTVIASGPGAMMSDLRTVIAARNSGAKVWRGEERFDVSLQCDDRLEY